MSDIAALALKTPNDALLEARQDKEIEDGVKRNKFVKEWMKNHPNGEFRDGEVVIYLYF
jgi:hypothetical protein